MRICLHDDDTGEPLTVLSLRWLTREYIEQHGRVFRVAAIKPFEVTAVNDFEPRIGDMLPICTIKCAPLWKAYKGKGEHWTYFFTTRESELALLLPASFLPGQYKEVQAHRERAKGEGFALAMALWEASEKGWFRPA